MERERAGFAGVVDGYGTLLELKEDGQSNRYGVTSAMLTIMPLWRAALSRALFMSP